MPFHIIEVEMASPTRIAPITLKIGGRKMLLEEVLVEKGISVEVYLQRLQDGWPILRAAGVLAA